MHDIKEFVEKINYLNKKLLLMQKRDVEEGILIFNEETQKYEETQEWDLFGYTTEQLLNDL